MKKTTYPDVLDGVQNFVDTPDVVQSLLSMKDPQHFLPVVCVESGIHLRSMYRLFLRMSAEIKRLRKQIKELSKDKQ